MRLVGQARSYWEYVERLSLNRRRGPLNTWEDMKDKLRERYVPTSYLHHLLDQWQRLTQGRQSVTEYIARFDEYFMRCRVREHLSTTLSRFRAGLRYDLHQELVRHKFHSLGEAYQFAEDYERYHQMPVTRQPGSPYLDTFDPRVPQPDYLQTSISHSPPLPGKEDKDEEIPVEGNQELSPVDNQCPSQDLNIVETEVESPDDPIEEEIYIADPELEETYEEQKNEVCEDINDSGRTTSIETISLPDLSPIEHLSLYSVTKPNVPSIPVGLHSLNPIDFDPYQKLVESNVRSSIIGKSRSTNQKVVQQNQTYPCSIPSQGKEVPFHLSPFKSLPRNDPLESKEKKRSPHIFDAKEHDKEQRNHHPRRLVDHPSAHFIPVWLLLIKQISFEASSYHPQELVVFTPFL